MQDKEDYQKIEPGPGPILPSTMQDQEDYQKIEPGPEPILPNPSSTLGQDNGNSNNSNNNININTNANISKYNMEGTFSRINGTGLWSSWQRNFKTPELALLDLFDNAVDATLQDDFAGKIDIYKDYAIRYDDDDDIVNNSEHAQGICLRNNCARRIPDLTRVLEVFGSSKEAAQIGENGVGTKQACAALSDLSIILTKNKEKLSIGFLNKSLQIDDGCCIPSFEFHFQTLQDDFDSAIAGSQEFAVSVKEYGEGDIIRGWQRIYSHCMGLKQAEDNYMFLVILHRIIHRGVDGGIDGMLKNMATIIPRNYLHIPTNFQISCGGQQLIFQYWERRLLELHSFVIKIDPSHDFNYATDWLQPNFCYELRVFIGFDPVRSKVENKNKASLLVYSRKCGRLVKELEDARGILGVTTGGTMFAQGLTVILDDHEGRLPLTPTKQDLAFGNEPTGKVHEENLFAWVGAFAHFYYTYFLDKHHGSKTNLGAQVQNQVDSLKELATVEGLGSLQSGNFSTFQDLAFTRTRVVGRIRCSNKTKCLWKSGNDSRITFQTKRPRPAGVKKVTARKSVVALPSPPPKKVTRKRKKIVESSDESDTEFFEKYSSVKRSNGSDLVKRLREEVHLQKAQYQKMLTSKEKRAEKLRKQANAFSFSSSSLPLSPSVDDISRVRVDALRRRREALEHQLAAPRKLKKENESLMQKIDAQKTYIASLQTLNESLRSMSGL